MKCIKGFIQEQTSLVNPFVHFLPRLEHMGMLKPFLEKVKTYDEVVNCYRITGNENIVMEVVLKNQEHLESFIDQLIIYGETKTQIVLSHVVKHSEIKPIIS